MDNSRFRPFTALLFTSLVVLLYTPRLVGQDERLSRGLTVRQQAEVLFQNGLRNAQRRDDVFGQMGALRKTLSEIRELRQQSDRAAMRDEKAMDHREKQLRRMIARQVPNEN